MGALLLLQGVDIIWGSPSSTRSYHYEFDLMFPALFVFECLTSKTLVHNVSENLLDKNSGFLKQDVPSA